MAEIAKPETPEEAKAKVAAMLLVADNKVCFDCPARNPTWASLTYAVFLCEECCGRHRGMGTHITFMRSVRLDSWEPDQAHRMLFGGNGPARKFFKTHGVMELAEKYTTTAAQQYRKQLDKAVKGKSAQWETIKAESPPASGTASPMSPSNDTHSPEPSGTASPVMLQGAEAPVRARPNLASKKKGKGLGGAKKVEASEVKLATTTEAIPDGFLPEKKKEVPKDEPIDLTQLAKQREASMAQSDDPYASASQPTSQSANFEAKETDYAKSYEAPQNKGRFYGIGSGGSAVRNETTDTSAPAVATHIPSSRMSAGPDYSGFGSTPVVKDADNGGIDMSDAMYTAGEKMGKMKDWMSQKSESVGGTIKNFLDEL
eukprot:TRINITY_DN1244_c0_g1_i1.p1 TRINITY_DN1244_c0_g1~~TRINITY_DN1244_c0_g1_i1.p1  ORF type:complete len:372 (+),score=158.22 TRINITY_DN1244_c0_g1_i1:96-1211(+)